MIKIVSVSDVMTHGIMAWNGIFLKMHGTNTVTATVIMETIAVTTQNVFLITKQQILSNTKYEMFAQPHLNKLNDVP